MIIKCIRNKFSDEEIIELGIVSKKAEFNISVGEQLIVLGLSFIQKSYVFGPGVCVDIKRGKYVIPLPFSFFEIVDPRSSRHWVLSRNQSNIVCLWPPSFFQPFYHDRLSDGDKAIYEDFCQVYQLLSDEFE
jgi:hypothetical protein